MGKTSKNFVKQTDNNTEKLKVRKRLNFDNQNNNANETPTTPAPAELSLTQALEEANQKLVNDFKARYEPLFVVANIPNGQPLSHIPVISKYNLPEEYQEAIQQLSTHKLTK